ncbi:MAG: Fe-S cluster assembly protein SufD [Anaerolineaceae bacterium]|nr:Fe-S cluster assembly protein SufD [Anaerolineaceae bacterium]
MTETPHIVTRTRRTEPVEERFQFTSEMIPAVGSPGMENYRQAGWKTFEKLPIPDQKDEAWRRTDLKRMMVNSFRLPKSDAYLDQPGVPARLLNPMADEQHGGEIVIASGMAKVKLDNALASQGVIFTDWQSAQVDHPGLLDRLVGKVVRADEGKFGGLAAALAQTGVLVYIPRGVQVPMPLHSLIWGPGIGLAHLTHVIVWLEEGASATYIHESSSPNEGGGQTLHSGIVEIHVGPAANLRFVELQSWGESVWNFSHERAQVERDGIIEWTFGAIGSHLTKNFTDLDLIGPGATGKMSGFYFTDHDQHLDHDTQQNHLAPSTTSDLLFKGALLGKSRSVWQGMIYVAPGAVKTDGYQANRNLVLSREARADSIPGLEILADDVRCTHGATVGKIDPEEIFYLLSRGIPKGEAERLVVEGFFDPIMQRIPFEGVKQRFQQAIHDKMGEDLSGG